MHQDHDDPESIANRAYEVHRAEWKMYTYEEFSRDLGEIRNRRMEDVSSDFGALFRNGKRLKVYLDEFFEEPHSVRNLWSFTMASEIRSGCEAESVLSYFERSCIFCFS